MSQTRIHRREQNYRSSNGEHPSVVLSDVSRQAKTAAHIIVFANEKGGVGKSTLAFHTAICLARLGKQVLAIDLDRRQRTFDRALENREATARSLGISLPSPKRVVVEQQSGAMLSQEIARVGSDCNVVVIDVAGHDSPIARRAIAMADTLVTPVNPTFVDLDTLANFNPATMKYTRMGRFAEMVDGLQTERAKNGLPKCDWLLVKNRVRRSESLQLKRFDDAIAQLPEELGVRLSAGLTERVAYRELFMFGLTHADCADLPGAADGQVRRGSEIATVIREFNLPLQPSATAVHSTGTTNGGPARGMKRYRKSLRAHIGAPEQALNHA